MAIATVQGRENLATAYGQAGTYLSLHTGNPGTNGASEVGGGSPQYARKSASWAAGGVDGVITTTVQFDVPACTVLYVGVWNSPSGGTFLDSASISSQTFTGQSTFQVTATFTET